MIKPLYPHQRIGTISALCAALNKAEIQVREVALFPESYYKESQTLKKNGKKRDIVIVLEPLKGIQTSIKQNLLDKVQMPHYLTGGIRNRDFLLNARRHSNSKILIQEDIKNFFPSITADQVKQIWTHFFKFSDEVASLLTQLTTYDGHLPQGTQTSVCLANLVLFQYEAEFYNWCKGQGLIYTRYIDDICVSSHGILSKEGKTAVINRLYGMLLRAGFTPQRSKHQCSTASQRMEIMGQVVNGNKPTLPREYRRKLRATVHNLQVNRGDRLSKQDPEFLSAMGKINHLSRFHANQAKKLKEDLLKCCKN